MPVPYHINAALLVIACDPQNRSACYFDMSPPSTYDHANCCEAREKGSTNRVWVGSLKQFVLLSNATTVTQLASPGDFKP
jgi:hypothetical protein